MTREDLVTYIVSIEKCLGVIKYHLEQTSGQKADEPLSEDTVLDVGDAILQLNEDLY